MDMYRWLEINRSRTTDARNAKDFWWCIWLPLWINWKDWFALIDKDYAYLDKYKWSLDSLWYAKANLWNKVIKRLHNVIVQLEDWKVTDHINRDKLDNRKENLRVVSQKINTRNSWPRERNNTWILWIHFSKRDKLFIASWGGKILWSSKDINNAIKLRANYEKSKELCF